MISPRYLTASVLLHAAVIGVIYGWVKVRPTESEREVVEIEWVGEENKEVDGKEEVSPQKVDEARSPAEADEPIAKHPAADLKPPEHPQPPAPPQPAEPSQSAQPHEHPQPSPPPPPPLPTTPPQHPQPPQIPQSPPAPPTLSPVATVQPKYPRKARLRGIEGQVKVRLQVSSSGEVATAEVSESSGSAMLDQAALDAAKTTRFKPNAHSDVIGEAVLTFDFRLK